MPKGHAVIDGSNIATEGRSEPSLKQLREAVAEFEAENDYKFVTVIVDASFEHRVTDREKRAARAAVESGDIITPPAGVIGRGDAFILEVADRASAVVLSNDSFQEFHGTYDWLFDDGRLIGGKPVPGVGWVYVVRTPVRGPVSRRATKKAVSTTRTADTAGSSRKRAATTTKKTTKATKKSTASPPAPEKAAVGSRRSRTGAAADTNTLARLRSFRRAHPAGSTVDAVVERFSSHGAYGSADGAIVYLPNQLLGDPPPNRARDVVSIGETRSFLVHGYHEERRGIDLGLIPVDGAAVSEDSTTTKRAATAKTRPKKKATKKSTKKARATTAAKPPAKKSTTAKAATKSAKKTPTKRATKKTTRAAGSRTFDNTT